MKPDDFDRDLRSVAGDFNLPVSNDLFAGVMLARKKKRRRAIALYLVGLVALFLAVTASIFLNTDTPSLPVIAENSGLPSRSGESQNISPKTGNKQVLHSALPEQTIAPTAALRPRVDPVTANSNTPAGRALTANTTSNTNSSGSLMLTLADTTVQEPKQRLLQKENTITAKTQHVTDNNNTDQPHTPDSVILVFDSAGIATVSANDSVLPPPPPQLKINANEHRFFAAGIYANYFAITNAINASSLIPFNSQDSFGLKNNARYAFSTGLRSSYQFHKNWSVSLGIGLYKLQFDRVRFEEISIDSTIWNELTNSGQKDARIYMQNITEHSLTWLEVPVGIAYTVPAGRRISFCTEAGVVYQTLLQNQVYEFTSSSAGDLTYTDKTNTGLDRLNKHTAAWYLQPGVTASLSSHISLFAGLNYRRQFISYYKKDYFNTGSFYMVGGHINLMYKF